MTAEQDRLVTENIGLVHACAKRYCGRGVDYDDLYQSGCEGLVKAAAGFDSSRGVKFSTYAVPAILGEMRRLFRDGGAMRVSRSLRDLGLKIRRAGEAFETQYGREPTVGELAALLDVDPESVAEAIDAARPVLSLSAARDGDEGETDIPTQRFDERLIDLVALRQVISGLPDRDRELIRLRYVNGCTQNEVACRLGMTQVQVSRRERRILETCKQLMT